MEPETSKSQSAANQLQTLHWRSFNFLARRVVAVAFMVVGSILTLSGIPHLLPGGTIIFNGAPTTDIVMRVIVVILPASVATLGFLLYRAKPFYPSRLK